MLELISKLIDTQFSKSSFKSGYFEKDDLISDLYLLLAESDKEFTEKELISLIKKKYFQYFDIYDIEDKKSYDKFENGVQSAQTIKKEVSVDKETNNVYEFFEKIFWKDGVTCPKCNSKEAYPSQKNSRFYDCRNCGDIFSFSQNSNLRMANVHSLKNIMTIYKLLLKGTICFREMQEQTGMSKKEVRNSYYRALPNIIHGEDLVKPIVKTPVKKEKTGSNFTEYAHQTQTIVNAVKYFKANTRGKIIHPCGSGKTYTSIRIAQELRPQSLLVVIPSRLLLKQQIERFVFYFEDYDFYAFGSLASYEKDFKKANVKVLGDSVIKQRQQIKLIDKNKKTVVFITLQSFCKMEQDFPENYFDFAIFDEAHRVAGEEYKSFLKVVNFKSYQKALFLTATEKNYNDDGAVGMNDPIFGDTISKIYMKEMVDQDVICDYNIINVGFEDEEVISLLEQHKEFFIEVKVKLPVKKRVLMSALSMVKCIEKYGIKKVITYHSTIEECQLFINIFKLLCNKYNLDYGCYAIHSNMNGSNFSYNLNNFINDEKAVISSVNCFQEGIDIVEVDAVLYGYHKQSKIDIPQSVGRCVRKSPNKEKGYVIIPEVEGKFNKLIKVLNALETVDPRISDFKSKEKISNEYRNLLFEAYSTSASEIFNFDYFYRNLDVYFNGEGFVSLEECMDFRRKSNVTSIDAWLSLELPKNFPRYPIACYNIKWSDFLETTHWSYEECRNWFKDNQKLGITSGAKMKKSKGVPKNIPRSIRAMRNKYGDEWGGWEHFLGLSDKKSNDSFLSYEETKEYVKKFKPEIKNKKSWDKWAKSKDFPNFLYKNLYHAFPNFSAIEFFNKNNTIHDKKRDMYSFKEAKEILKNLDIKSPTLYQKYIREGKISSEFPINAVKVYKKEWKGWKDYLGRSEFFTYEEAKEWLTNNNILIYLKLIKQWDDFKKNKLPLKFDDRIPKSPIAVYRNEWKGWDDFLGGKFYGSRYKTFKDCKSWAQSKNITTVREFLKERLHDNTIPYKPANIYKDEWKGWDDFLNRK